MKSTESSNVRQWSINPSAKVSVGDFNNVNDIDKFGIYPGQRGDAAYTVIPESAENVNMIDYRDEDYLYSCFKSGYFYGITTEKSEIIGIYKDNKITPVFAGAGKFILKSGNGSVLFSPVGIESYTIGETDGYESVTVSYTTDGDYKLLNNCSITYIFKDRCFSAVVHIDCIGMSEGVNNAAFSITHLNTADKVKKQVSYDWIYPENNDFAYAEVDAYVQTEIFGDTALCAFVRDENSNHKIHLRNKNIGNFPVNIARGTQDINYIYKIDYAVVSTDGNSGYEAFFKGKGFDFAAGVASVEENERTTFFSGKNVTLNINVKNITDSDITYGVKYNLMDYYNREIDAHEFYGNLLPSGGQANRNLDLQLDNYGMYYLNLYVTTDNHEYRECYTFTMLEPFDFKHRDENPFGICATHTETEENGDSTISILNHMGLSIVRLGCSYDQRHFIDHMKESGIKRYCIGAGWCPTPEHKEKFLSQLKKVGDGYAKDLSYFLIANEVDSKCKGDYDKSLSLLRDTFVPLTYSTAYEYISQNHPEVIKKTIWESNCHGTTEWLEAFHETGMWDNSEIIDIHSYSSPSGPDKIFSNRPCSMFANMYSNEYAMIRWKRIQNRYGKKRMIIGETGYPSPSIGGDTKEIDIRTQADFNTRIALFFLEAGAEDIIYYCLYDRTTDMIGTSDWTEMYFGACYNYNFYGVYMPKPWAAAYANITRRFDGYVSCTFNSKYEEDEWGTLRAFDVKTKDNGNFTVVWSNIYQQPNTSAEGRINNVERIPMPAWETRWKENEVRKFSANGKEVKVIDIMGNSRIYDVIDGTVEIPVSGSPIFIYGIEG